MRKILRFIIAGVVVVMAVVFASYVVLSRFHPEREIRLMQAHMARTKGFEFNAGLSWGSREEDEQVNTTLYASGKVVSLENGSVDHATKFRAVRLSSGRDYTDLSGEIRRIGDEVFLTYEPPGPEVAGVDFSEETWIRFDKGELESWGEILPGANWPIELITSEGGWTAEAIARLRTLVSMTDVLLVEYNGLTEIVDGKATRIIDGRLDADAVEVFLLDLVRAKYGEEPDDEERILAHKAAGQLARLDLRFWVGINDHMLYRAQATGPILIPPLPEGGLGGVGVKLKNESVQLGARFEFSEFDAAIVPINEPAAIDFADVYRLAFGSLPSSGASSATRKTLLHVESARLPSAQVNESNDIDMDGLDNILEVFYGTSASNPDTDQDGVNDGNEVRSGRNPRGSGSLFGFGLD